MMPRAITGESQPLKNLGTDQRSVPDPAGAEERMPPRQARAKGMATNFVVSSDFTRMSTACLPFFWASPTALRTSAAVATLDPPTSRMTSPLLSPCSEASPSGIDLSHDHAFGPASGNLPSRGERHAKLRQARHLLRRSPDWWRGPLVDFGSSPSVSEKLFSSPLRQTVSLAVAPGVIEPICLARS